ncbi:MAG TPA: hypothetical protein VF832_04040 [Longimicrobiales bacterium]
MLLLALAACDRAGGTPVAPPGDTLVTDTLPTGRYRLVVDSVGLVRRSRSALLAAVAYRRGECDDSVRFETSAQHDTLLLSVTAVHGPGSCFAAGRYVEGLSVSMPNDSASVLYVLARQPTGAPLICQIPPIPIDSARFVVSMQGNLDLLRPALTMEATTDGFAQVWRGAEFGGDVFPNHVPWVTTPLHGTLHVVARLAGGDGSTAAQGAIDLTLQPDRFQGVDIWLTGRNPAETCFGCLEVKAFPVPAAFQKTPRDSLYLVRGMNSIKYPMIY